MAERAIPSRAGRLWPWLAVSLAGHGLLLALWQQPERPTLISDSLAVSIELLPAPEPAIAKSAPPARPQLAETVEMEPAPAEPVPAKRERELVRAMPKRQPPVAPPAPVEPLRQTATLPAAPPVPLPERAEPPASAPQAVQLARTVETSADRAEMAGEQTNRLVREHLESFKFYPGGARRRGLEGHVDVAFTLVGRGLATAVTVLEGSGHDILDRAALETVSRAQPFPVERGSYRFRLNFRRL